MFDGAGEKNEEKQSRPTEAPGGSLERRRSRDVTRNVQRRRPGLFPVAEGNAGSANPLARTRTVAARQPTPGCHSRATAVTAPSPHRHRTVTAPSPPAAAMQPPSPHRHRYSSPPATAAPPPSPSPPAIAAPPP
ncbi:unnamed protein product [Lampetra fluviatilis]